MKKIWNYFRPLIEGNDNKISLRSVSALGLIVDFIINTHNSSNVMIKVLQLIQKDKVVDAGVVAAMAANLGQIVMVLGIEAGLITALLALKAYQQSNSNVETKTHKTEIQETIVKPTE